jgi:pyruvate formate lyase activating enzyme
MALKPELAFYPDKCNSCGDCMEACGSQAISMNGHLKIDRAACIVCNDCTEVCLTEALQLIGSEYSAEAVMKEILRDLDYYQTSGGGVTFSGGEPTLHFELLLQLLHLCKSHGIHTNIETNGYFSRDKFKQLLPYLDLIYFDIKILDPEKNRTLLGGDSERIISNMKYLLEQQAPVEFRLPIVPGFTTTPENLSAIINLLTACGVRNIHLLPYHSMGESKADKIDSCIPRLNLAPYSTEELEQIRTVFRHKNIMTILYR